jgi:N-acetyl-anhydromuramyl-L-alanine amidase AmpD
VSPALLGAALVAAALALPGTADAARPQHADRFVPAHSSNYAKGHRSPALIRYVVIHTIEGSYWGAISWFQNPKARVSAHYVVGRGGDSTQMVALDRSAWHAGNGWMNMRSVGIEHEGYAHVPWTIADADYRASARIAAAILRSRVLPIDRRHVIGHSEVPHPSRPGRLGGFSGRTDPGPHWDWARYMAYVRSYARGQTPPPRPFDVTVPGIGIGSVLADRVRWEAVTSGARPARVEFRVDGVRRAVLTQPPFVLATEPGGWDTTFEENGRRTLTVRAVSADGRVAGATMPVTIRNPTLPPPSIASLGLAEGQVLCGPVRWEAKASRGARWVEFVVDGVVRDRQPGPTFVFGGPEGVWDTAAEAPGPHTVELRAVGPRGLASAHATVHVLPAPCPEPEPEP